MFEIAEEKNPYVFVKSCDDTVTEKRYDITDFKKFGKKALQ
jgi:hypothetical protein